MVCRLLLSYSNGKQASLPEMKSEENPMSKTIAKPKLVAHKSPVFEEAPAAVRPEKKVESLSRSEVEVWNSTFPRRAWLAADTDAVESGPRVRPAGHERGDHAQETAPDEIAEILNKFKSAGPQPGEAPGLCRNCARLSDCTYPRPESGVWHCEEYE
jgi:hypothetical protein